MSSLLPSSTSIRIIRGLVVARQLVVNKANGKHIIFADADVKLFDDFTKKHVSFVEENPNAGVAFGKPM